jgi:hypothetical protein
MKERRETRLRDDVCAVPQHASHHRFSAWLALRLIVTVMGTTANTLMER